MKKIVFTAAALVLISLNTNAQTELKPAEPAPAKQEVINADGTTSVVEAQPAQEPKKQEDPKKSGTRMAINQKAISPNKKPKTTTSNKEATTTEQPKKTEDKKNTPK